MTDIQKIVEYASMLYRQKKNSIPLAVGKALERYHLDKSSQRQQLFKEACKQLGTRGGKKTQRGRKATSSKKQKPLETPKDEQLKFKGF